MGVTCCGGSCETPWAKERWGTRYRRTVSARGHWRRPSTSGGSRDKTPSTQTTELWGLAETCTLFWTTVSPLTKRQGLDRTV